MIKLVDEGTAAEFTRFCADDPVGLRMAAALRSCGTGSRFADFWTVGEGENTVGAIAKVDSSATFLGTASSETAHFLRAVGARRVTGYADTLLSLGFGKEAKKGHIMCYTERTDKYATLPKAETYDFKMDFSPSVMLFAKLLAQSEGESVDVGSFDVFYADLSHRVRHGTAVCALGYFGVQAVATAAASVGENAAVISAVSVPPRFRNRGFGSAAVLSLIEKIREENKNIKIYLYRAEDENGDFYRGLGFSDFSRWAIFEESGM